MTSTCVEHEAMMHLVRTTACDGQAVLTCRDIKTQKANSSAICAWRMPKPASSGPQTLTPARASALRPRSGATDGSLWEGNVWLTRSAVYC